MALYMPKVRVTGRILRWGNSFGLRLRKADLERVGLKEGADVVADLETAGKVDLSHVRTFKGDPSDVAERHDEYYGRGLWEEYRRQQRAARRRRSR